MKHFCAYFRHILYGYTFERVFMAGSYDDAKVQAREAAEELGRWAVVELEEFGL